MTATHLHSFLAGWWQTPAAQDKPSLSYGDLLAALGLALLTVVLFFYFLRTPHLSDPFQYFQLAWHLSGGDAAIPAIAEMRPRHWDLRVGVVWPTWAIMQLFGYSEISYYFVPLLSALLLSMSTWLLGRLLFGTWVGLCAGALIILNPWVLDDITRLGPDYLAAGLFTLSLAMIVALGQYGRLGERPLRGSTYALLFGAGVLLGWSYLAREFVVILFPVVPLTLLALRSRIVAIAPVAFGAFLCWVAELVWGLAMYGNPITRLLIVWRPGGKANSKEFATDFWGAVTELPSQFAGVPGGWLFATLSVIALAGTALLAMSGRRWQVVAAWLVGGWLFFTIIALMPVFVLEEGRVILRMNKFRYWAIILPPLFVGGFAVIQWGLLKLADIAPHSIRSRAASIGLITVGVGIMLVAGQAAYSLDGNDRLVRNNSDYLELREFLRGANGQYDAVVLGAGGLTKASTIGVPLYMKEWHGWRDVWRGTTEIYSFDDLPRAFGGSGKKLLVIDRTHIDYVARRFRPPDEFTRPERHAAEVFRSAMGNLVAYDLSRPPRDPEVLYEVSASSWELYRSGADELEELDHGGSKKGEAAWVALGEGETVYFHDGQGERLARPEIPQPVTVSGDNALVGHILLTEMSGGNRNSLRVLCLFYDENGRTRSRALHWVDEVADPPGVQAAVRFECTTPQGSEQYEFRVAMVVRGPISLRLGSASVFVRPHRTIASQAM